MRHLIFTSILLLTTLIQAAEPSSVQFAVRQLTVDANEGIAAADVDNDGRLDIVSGRNWYRNAEWSPRPLRIIEDWNGYVQSNGDFVEDINGDGLVDVVAGSFLPTELKWFENPGAESLRLGKMWSTHLLVDTGQSANEGALQEDLDGDGRKELIVNSWQNDVPMAIWRFVNDESGKGLVAKRHQLGESGNGHGCGVGDINNDDRNDVLVGQGWYEQPSSGPWDKPWKFHADWNLQASLPMLVVDLNQDGTNDLIHGHGHDYGLVWWERTGQDPDGKLKFKEHLIDRGFSEPHALAWGDVNGDGKSDLVTGKRYYSHNGGDPGGNEPPCIYYYTWNPEKLEFARHVIEEGHVGIGLQIVLADFNADGNNDIAVAGKSGTHLLINQGPKASE